MYNNSIEKIMVFREFNSRYFMANILPLLQSNPFRMHVSLTDQSHRGLICQLSIRNHP